MSYRSTAALQTAIYQHLTAFPGLAGIPVMDSLSPGTAPVTFILIGPEVARDLSDKTGSGSEHELEISVISTATGFLAAKSAASHVSIALDGTLLTLTVGRLVSLRFKSAKAARLDEGDTRRIDMTFRARVDF